MRLAYALDYPARPDSWYWPEDYPLSWDVLAYIDTDILESDYDTIQADAQGRIPVAKARVYMIPDVGAAEPLRNPGRAQLQTVPIRRSVHRCRIPAQPAQHRRGTGPPWRPDDRDLGERPTPIPWAPGRAPSTQSHPPCSGPRTVVTVLQAAPGLQDGTEEGSTQHHMESDALAKYWGELAFRPLHRDEDRGAGEQEEDNEPQDELPSASIAAGAWKAGRGPCAKHAVPRRS